MTAAEQLRGERHGGVGRITLNVYIPFAVSFLTFLRFYRSDTHLLRLPRQAGESWARDRLPSRVMVEEEEPRAEAHGSPVPQETQVPFALLLGECVEHIGRTEESIIALTSYRLHIKLQDSVINVPLRLIESVECRDLTQLHLFCKDCKVIRCHFLSADLCQDWLRRISAVTRPPARLEQLFAFNFLSCRVGASVEDREVHDGICRAGGHQRRFKRELQRMGLNTHSAWRISNINSNYRVCSSYPEQILVPAAVSDPELENVASFRSWKRIPAVVYRHQSSGAVIGRCGQPEVSWWGWRNADDEHLIQAIAKACAADQAASTAHANGSCVHNHLNGSLVANGSAGAEPNATPPQKLLIMDARSYAAAVANRAKGGGCECPEYYPNCEVMFMGMANIHCIRKSFQSLRTLCAQSPDPLNWLSALEGTRWLQHLSLLLKASVLVVNAVDRERRPVLVHCSDGWDRTPQIVALAKLMLDPFYRTIEGFQVLVESEWLDFGHKFADRCGQGESEDVNERCPVFLQWLDCVHQLQRQFPCSFQFSEAFLVKLVQHTYSCLFGTFLCNSVKEREEKRLHLKSCSVWALLRPSNPSLHNILYSPRSETVLRPVCHVRNLMLWSAVYLPSSAPSDESCVPDSAPSTPSNESCVPDSAPSTPSDESCVPDSAPSPKNTPLCRLPKTRSCDDLPTSCEGLTSSRRNSDPNLQEKWRDHLRALEIAMTTDADKTQTRKMDADKTQTTKPESDETQMTKMEMQSTKSDANETQTIKVHSDKTQTTKPAPDGTQMTKPIADETQITKPDANETQMTKLDTNETQTSKPDTDETQKTKPDADKIQTTKPDTDETKMTKPVTDKRKRIKPAADKTQVTKPDTDKTKMTKPVADETQMTKPDADETRRSKSDANETHTTQQDKDETQKTKLVADETQTAQPDADETQMTQPDTDKTQTTKLVADETQKTKSAPDETQKSKPDTDKTQTTKPDADETQMTQPDTDQTQTTKLVADKTQKTKSAPDETQKSKPDTDKTQTTKPDADETQRSKTDTDKTKMTKLVADETQMTKPDADKTQRSKSDANETQMTKLVADEAQMTKPDANETQMTQPDTDETQATKPDANETQTTQLDTDKTQTTKLVADETQMTKPDTDKTKTTKPAKVKGKVTKTATDETQMTKPDADKTQTIKPNADDMQMTNPDKTEMTKPVADEIQTTKLDRDKTKTTKLATDKTKITKTAKDKRKRTKPAADKTQMTKPDKTQTTKLDADETQTTKAAADDSLNQRLDINTSQPEPLNTDPPEKGARLSVTHSQSENTEQEVREEDNRKLDLLNDTPAVNIPVDLSLNRENESSPTNNNNTELTADASHLNQDHTVTHDPSESSIRSSKRASSRPKRTRRAQARTLGHMDGSSCHGDAVQARLRQVETLKKHVQELWSRLHSSGKLASLPDGENNVECERLKHCGATHLRPESSWEQHQQQEAEVKQWFSDHPASRCYGCERMFWLAARKHHCSSREPPVDEAWNCGNVFCTSCCDQKVALASQQQQRQVCEVCVGQVCSSSVPLEMEEPIAASSN